MGKATQIAAVVVTLAMAGSDQLQAAQPSTQQTAIDRSVQRAGLIVVAAAPGPRLASEQDTPPGTRAQDATESGARAPAPEPAPESASESAEAPAEGPAESYVSLKLEGACDERNNRLWLTNTHTFKTIATTVRWRAAGGKDLTDQFFPGPNSVREIGCAAEGAIVEAKFAAF